MGDFIRTYPEMVVVGFSAAFGLLSTLVGFIIYLLGLLFKSVAKTNEDLTIEVRELKNLVSPLINRMSRLETRCAEKEKICPAYDKDH